MSGFDEFVARRNAERAAQPARVTWRAVGPETGGGYSGITRTSLQHGLVARIRVGSSGRGYDVWLARNGAAIPGSACELVGQPFAAAKERAAEMLREEEARV
jgi:hypothetical protein